MGNRRSKKRSYRSHSARSLSSFGSSARSSSFGTTLPALDNEVDSASRPDVPFISPTVPAHSSENLIYSLAADEDFVDEPSPDSEPAHPPIVDSDEPHPEASSSPDDNSALIHVGAPMSVGIPTENVSNNLDSISPAVVQEVAKSSTVNSYDWMDIAFDIGEGTLRGYAKLIKEKNWLRHEKILPWLLRFCDAEEKEDRYWPFVQIAQAILELGLLPDHAIDGLTTGLESYPIDDISHVVHSNKEVTSNPLPEDVTAGRKPDVVVVRGADGIGVTNAAEGDAVSWSQIFTWWEFKFRKSLKGMLDKSGQPIPSVRLDTIQSWVISL